MTETGLSLRGEAGFSFLGHFTCYHKVMAAPRINRKNYIVTLLLCIAGINVLLLLAELVSRAAGKESAWTLLMGCLLILVTIYITVVCVAAAARRSRDFNLPAWAGALIFLLVPFGFIIIAAIPGTKGKNQYGPAPHSKIDLKFNFLS